MTQGRKVVSMVEKKARGTARKSREREVPEPSEKNAIPPSKLNKRAKQIFNHLVKRRFGPRGLGSATYTEQIARIATCEEKLEKLNETLEIKGMTYWVITKDGGKMIKQRPEFVMWKDLTRIVNSLYSDFGATPAAAQKVGPVKKPNKPKPKDRFFS